MDLEKIKQYVEQGLISENIHPEDENVRIYNYTPEVQFDRKWDDTTIMCRGLILNIKTGEILARPFEKFFNNKFIIILTYISIDPLILFCDI